jgi:hypothetical protein
MIKDHFRRATELGRSGGARRSDRPKQPTKSLRASVSSDRSAQALTPLPPICTLRRASQRTLEFRIRLVASPMSRVSTLEVQDTVEATAVTTCIDPKLALTTRGPNRDTQPDRAGTRGFFMTLPCVRQEIAGLVRRRVPRSAAGRRSEGGRRRPLRRIICGGSVDARSRPGPIIGRRGAGWEERAFSPTPGPCAA